jgi:hypothetical protein
MSNLKQYIIPFIGLKQGKHLFEYEIDNTFFEAFNYDEFESSSIKISNSSKPSSCACKQKEVAIINNGNPRTLLVFFIF